MQTFALVFAAALPEKSNGYIRVDCYGGLNQMRRDVSNSLHIFVLVTCLLLLSSIIFTCANNFADGDYCSSVMVLVLLAC